MRWCPLVAACRGGSCSLGCHGYLPALPSLPSGPHQLSRHHFPTLTDEFKFPFVVDISFKAWKFSMGIFLGSIVGPGIFLGCVGSPGDFFWILIFTLIQSSPSLEI